MSLVSNRTQFTRSEEEMFARFQHVTLSPRSSLINALLSDDSERLFTELETSHQALSFVDLLVGCSALKNKVSPAALVTLVSRIYTMNAYSQKSMDELFRICSLNKTPQELGSFLEKFFFVDEHVCDMGFISDTISRVKPLISATIAPESLLPPLALLYDSRHVPKHLHLPIVLALAYLSSTNQDEHFDEERVAKKTEFAEFIIRAISSDKKTIEAYAALINPSRWSKEFCDLLFTQNGLNEQFCLDIARVDLRIVSKWLDGQTELNLSFIAKLMHVIASRGVTDTDIFHKLEALPWEQNAVQLHQESFYKQFAVDILAITTDDFFINKSIDTILIGLKQLKDEFDPLIMRLKEQDRIEYLKTRLIEIKVQALGVIFLLASKSKNPRLTANIYTFRLLNLRLTDRDQEPMVSCDNSALRFNTHQFHF